MRPRPRPGSTSLCAAQALDLVRDPERAAIAPPSLRLRCWQVLRAERQLTLRQCIPARHPGPEDAA